MPSIRVDSQDTFYAKWLPVDRRSLSENLQMRVAEVREEKLSDVECRWNSPFEAESAVNCLPLSVDVELSSQMSSSVIDALAEAVLDAVQAHPKMSRGIGFGVWIKSPFQFYWKERTNF